jgi:hypothetical protein
MTNYEMYKTPGLEQDLLEESQNLVLAYFTNETRKRYNGESVRIAEFELVFLEVQAYTRVSYRGLVPRDSSGNQLGPLDPQSGTGFTRLSDQDGNDVLRVETSDSPWLVTHTSLGVLQDSIRVYPRIPETETHPGFSWANPSEPSSEDGSPYGYVSGKEMEYYNPPSALQSVSFQSGDRSLTQFGFYNEHSSRRYNPILNVQGRTYRVVPISDPDVQESVLDNAIGGGQGSRLLNYGPVASNYTISFPEEWEDADCIKEHSGRLDEFRGDN